jgi:hypothetical protein
MSQEVKDDDGVIRGSEANKFLTSTLFPDFDDDSVFFTATPLFQTSFVPDLMQVNFFPPVVDVAPAFGHLAPAFAAAKEGVAISEILRTRTRNNRNRFMAKRYQSAIPNYIANWSEIRTVLVTYCF